VSDPWTPGAPPELDRVDGPADVVVALVRSSGEPAQRGHPMRVDNGSPISTR
jgi:hypothetical protein